MCKDTKIIAASRHVDKTSPFLVTFALRNNQFRTLWEEPLNFAKYAK